MEINKATSNSLLNTYKAGQTKADGDFASILNQSAAGIEKSDAKLKTVCREMESVFLNLMLTQMRATVPKSELVDRSQEEIMQSMLDSELTKNMAQAGGMGLADMLYRQLKTSAPDANIKGQALK